MCEHPRREPLLPPKNCSAMSWTQLVPLAKLAASDRTVVKAGGRQIAVFRTARGFYACNNRCPHEGYPLAEGSLSDGCILTCNWHNWKFDLESGATLVGGDTLRRYPVEIRDGHVWADLSELPAAERIERALDRIRSALDEHAYDRIARELGRLELAGGDPLEALRRTITDRCERFEFGTSHAAAGTTDWLALRARTDPERVDARVVTILESLGHFAWDTLRERLYPFAETVIEFDPDELVNAIEAEDEERSIALTRGAFAQRLGFAGLERPLTRAALAHYQDFGHSLIYVLKTRQLIERLGAGVTEPLCLMLVRSLSFASREDLIPEFKSYRPALARWGKSETSQASVEDFIGLDIADLLAAIADRSTLPPETLYQILLAVNAFNMLHFDLSYQSRTNNPVAQNVGWLDFTHGITFANAVRHQCTRFPDLWAAGLLQMGCFAGRNARYARARIALEHWLPEDPEQFFESAFESLFDHGQPEYIVSCHILKLLTAAQEEYRHAPEGPAALWLLAAVNRFLNSPLKRKHTLRTARQSIEFVANE